MSRSNSSKRRVRDPIFRQPNAGRCPHSGKQRWDSKRGARQHIRTLVTGDLRAEQLRIYRCPDGCGAWHVGHRLKRAPRPRREGATE